MSMLLLLLATKHKVSTETLNCMFNLSMSAFLWYIKDDLVHSSEVLLHDRLVLVTEQLS